MNMRELRDRSTSWYTTYSRGRIQKVNIILKQTRKYIAVTLT